MAKVKEVSVQIRGVSYKPNDLHDELDDNSVILLRANNIEDDKVNLNDVVYVDKSRVSDSQYLQTGDILVCASSGSKNLVGKATIIKDDIIATFGAFCKVVRPKSILPQYLGHYFTSPKYRNTISELSAGANINNIRNEHIDSLDIPLPPLETQRQIASNLDKVTHTIDLCNAILKKLDLLVKSRFVEMFGDEHDFDRWDCCTVGDVANVCVGVVIKPTQYYTEKGIPAFRSLNIGEMNVKDKDWVYFTEEGHQKNQKSVIRENDVLVVRSGAPGTACVATKQYAGFNAVDIIIAHPDNSKINSIFLSMYTNMPHGMNQIRGNIGGAAQQHFNVGGYKALRIILPPLALQDQFAAFVEQTDKSKLAVKQVQTKAETLKKALMQEYFG